MLNSTLHLQLSRIRRRKWIVAVIVLVFVIAGVTSVLTTGTIYSSKAALDATSQTRSPEQDATLASGYVDFFNDPVYQATLRERAGVPGDVTFEAETAAASPLIYIVASSSNDAVVRLAASKMATAMLDTVNDARRASRDDTIAAVRKPYDDTRAANGVIPQEALIQMQSEINQLNANTTNQLSTLELDTGITSTSPNVIQTVGLALFAGVVVGCAVALAMGSLTRRVESDVDLTERTGLSVLAVVPRANESERAQRYGQLANALGRSDPASVLAVASVRELGATAPAAWAVAAHRADQGVRVLVLDANLGTPGSRPGLAEYLSATDAIDVGELIQPSTRHPGVFEVGRGAAVASVRAVDDKRFEKLLSELRDRAELLVVIAPPVVETAASQVVCAAADTTVFVVERSVTRTADVNQAQRLLSQVDARLAGAVLIEKGAEKAVGPERGVPELAAVPASVESGDVAPETVRTKGSTSTKPAGVRSVRTSNHPLLRDGEYAERELPAWDLTSAPESKV